MLSADWQSGVEGDSIWGVYASKSTPWHCQKGICLLFAVEPEHPSIVGPTRGRMRCLDVLPTLQYHDPRDLSIHPRPCILMSAKGTEMSRQCCK